jgi:hypothetical protein
MNKEKNKNTFVMVTLMALPVALGAMFFISKNIKNEEVAVINESLIIPEVDDFADVDYHKAKIYRDEQEETMFKKNTDARNVASDKDFFAIDSDFGKEEKKQENIIDRETQQVLDQYREQEPKTAVKTSQPRETANHPQAKKQPASQTYSSNNQTFHQPAETKTTENVADEKPQRRSSMGVYTADRSSTVSTINSKMDQSKKYLKAVLEEDKTIQNGSNVIFVLSEDGNIDGTTHKRGSILYGRANQGREFFEISIYQIKSANDGNMYPADLIVYDENYNRGIRSEGFLNEVSKEEGAHAATETIDAATQGATSVNALDLATRAITRTASRTVRSKPITIPLRKGYKVYLQPKPKE